MKLGPPSSPRESTAINCVPERTERCRICQVAKPLTNFRRFIHKGYLWPCYVCIPGFQDLQRQADFWRKANRGEDAIDNQ